MTVLRPAPATGSPTRSRGGGATTVGVVLLVAALAAELVAPDLVARAATPVAIVGVLVGIPHGAVDHVVPFWLAGTSASARALVAPLLSYVGVAALAAVALLVAPTVTVALFLLVSALHFGRAEVVFAAERDGRPTPPARHDAVLAVAHGATVVVLPLLLWHPQTGAVLRVIAPGLAGTPPTWAVVLGVAGVAVLVAAAGLTLLRTGRWSMALELLLVTGLFVVVPPLVAFGVYFGAWHALRHTDRLLALPGPDGEPLARPAALRRYALHAAGPTAVAFAALWVVSQLHAQVAVSAAVAVLLALTFPHLRAVAALDRATLGERTHPSVDRTIVAPSARTRRRRRSCRC